MIDRLAIAGSSENPLLRQAIHTLKYKNAEDLAQNLTDWMIGALAQNRFKLEDSPLFTSVPLHPRRLRERGFNQADLLARHISKFLAMDNTVDLLERVRYTSSQVKAGSRWERIDNMKDAFRCSKPELVSDRNIILVDDVCTTGATLQACAHALKSAGARTVTAFVLARG